MSKTKKSILGLSIFILLSLLTIPKFVYIHFGDMDIEQVIFVVLGNNTGANYDIILLYLKIAFINLIVTIISVLVLSFIQKKLKNYMLDIDVVFFKFKKTFHVFFEFSYKLIFISVLISMIFISFAFNNAYKISAYIKSQSQNGSFYETYYVDPNDVSINFPNEKTNLIYIIAESLSTNFINMAIEDGTYNLIPELERLAIDNVSFSNTSGFGGFSPIRGTTWTMGSLVSQTGGIPLAGPLNGNTYGRTGDFLPGLRTLGEILYENGYNNYFSIGSEAEFSGRDVYFKSHGNYEIFDLNYWKQVNKIPSDYHVFWGMEDQKLFDFSKEKLLEISKNDEPFNYTILTVDSHFTDGYTDDLCDLKYTTAYANAISCADKKIVEFVEWASLQDFYDNTVIVVVGDHPTMNQDFLDKSTISEENVFNAFINLSSDKKNLNLTNRIFNSTDLFPTTLAALNATVEGERLGLGTNLFSDSKTLMEELGVHDFEAGIALRSNYYIRKFHHDSEE